MTIRTFSSIRKAKRLRGGRGVPSAESLEKLGDHYSRIVSVSLNQGITKFKKTVNYDSMADAVYSGDYAKVLEHIPLNKLGVALSVPMDNLAEHMAKVGDISAMMLPSGTAQENARYSIGADNPKVQDYLNVRTGALITNITDDTQVNVQTAIKNGLALGQTKDEVAGEIKKSIGLTTRQNDALTRYTNQLTADGHSPDNVADMSGRYQERLLTQRADVIARTETSYAQNQAQLTVWDNAREDGLLTGDATKIWMTESDPCPRCRELANVEVPLDEDFETDEGPLPGPPLHPNCRCTLALGTGENAGADAPNDSGDGS